jgi:hypothetical protein
LLLEPAHSLLDRLAARLRLGECRNRRGGEQDQAKDMYAHHNPRNLNMVNGDDI